MKRVAAKIPLLRSTATVAREIEQWTTPDPWRNEDGVYVNNGQVWLYRALTLTPVKWEDPSERLGVARQLAGLLSEIGQTSKKPIGGIRQLSNNREFHLVSTTWQKILEAPDENAPALKEFQSDAYGVTVPCRALMLGVKLRSAVLAKDESKPDTGLWSNMQSVVRRTIHDDVPDLGPYRTDMGIIETIFSRYDAELPTLEQFNQLESWFNEGQGADVLIEEDVRQLQVADHPPIQMSAIRKFETMRMKAPEDQWLLDTLSHPGDAPHLISVRGELEPTSVTRGRARSAQRRIQANIEEEQASGDLEKAEQTESFEAVKELDGYLAAARQPMLSSVSFVMASEITEESEKYQDFMESTYGIMTSGLEHRQILALDETLPCSEVRVNPFLQDVNVAMLANAGLQAFSELGDSAGCFAGFIDPDGAPLFIDPSASSRQNLPPAFGVFGDPGSGKTFFAQSFATQCVLSGLPVFFINPKAADKLEGLIDYINDSTPAAATSISMHALEDEPGAFDPFRFANDPSFAAEVAAQHILAALDQPDDRLGRDFRLSLESGLKRGAENGASCVWEALKYIGNDDHKEYLMNLVDQQVQANSLFAIGIGMRPRGRLDMDSHLTLLNFDREIGLPEKTDESQYTVSERIALSTVNLVTKAALEILIANKGGVLILDEAWTFLSQPQSLASLNRISREGRSLNIVPVFLTQRIKDVITNDLEGFMSRVLVLKLNEKVEAEAAVRICGLKPTADRLEMLRYAGPVPAQDGKPAKWAEGLFRDLKFRHAWVALGPTPEDALKAWSTNPDDKKKFEEEKRLRLEEAQRDAEDTTFSSFDQSVPAPEEREVSLEKGDAPAEAPAVTIDKDEDVPAVPPEVPETASSADEVPAAGAGPAGEPSWDAVDDSVAESGPEVEKWDAPSPVEVSWAKTAPVEEAPAEPESLVGAAANPAWDRPAPPWEKYSEFGSADEQVEE